jgi:hypothetical protein
MRAKESLNRNWMRLLEQLLELVSVFKEASKKLCIDFSQELSRLKIKNNLRMSRKYRINFYRPSKKIFNQ